jgi:hypothetical protein
MKNNNKIIGSIFVVFLVSIILLGISEQTVGKHTDVDLITKTEFFSQNFTENNTIFLLGSSHVRSLNASTINEVISSQYPEITVFNLAKPSHFPFKELRDSDLTIKANPKIVYYGISYRDFQFPFDANLQNSIFPDFKLSFNQFLSEQLEDNFPSNPQATTRIILRMILADNYKIIEKKSSCDEIFNKYTPFTIYCKNTKILSNRELQNVFQDPPTWNDSEFTKINKNALFSFVNKMNENGIKIIIFTTPLQKYYIESLSDIQKKEFNIILDELKSKYNVKIYHYELAYQNLDIWEDTSHVSYKDNIDIYNFDIVNMILKELNS